MHENETGAENFFDYNFMIPYIRYCADDLYEKDWNLRERIIQDHELIYITSGEGIFKINGKEHHVKPGILLVIKPGIAHSARSIRLPFGFSCVHFDIYVSGNSPVQIPVPADMQTFQKVMLATEDIIEMKDKENAGMLFNELITWTNMKNPVYMHLVRAYFIKLLYEISAQEHDFDIKRRYTKSIEAVMNYIKANFSSKITLKDISSHVHLDASYISSLFKKQTGTTITGYINALRIEHCAKMLLETDMSIEDIAAGAGFYDIHHFSRNFKKTKGVTPSAYGNMKRY